MKTLEIYELKDKVILLISPEAWDHIFVSKHHYAVHLAKQGSRVFFLNPPEKSEKVLETEYENVWSVYYKKFIKGVRFFPSGFQKFFIRRKFDYLQELCQTKFDIVWSFDNSVFFDFSALPNNTLKISHIVDLNQDFQTAKAARTADICFGVCSPIVGRLHAYNRNTFFINHGCCSYGQVEKISLPGNNRVKILYAGNLNIDYIDWQTFREVIAGNCKVDFILAGPWATGEIRVEIQSFSNVYYIGQLKTEELRKYYTAADILLLLYKADEFPDQLSNSHKMMEYLASGKMIVATHTREYKRLADEGLFLMSNENKSFPQLVNCAIRDLTYWNLKGKKKARQEYALLNTYDRQISKIEALL